MSWRQSPPPLLGQPPFVIHEQQCGRSTDSHLRQVCLKARYFEAHRTEIRPAVGCRRREDRDQPYPTRIVLATTR